MSAGILAVSQALPEDVWPVEKIFEEECPGHSPEVVHRLGIRNVHLCSSETGSVLALRAAEKALDEAGISAEAIDIIVDYSILPQEYLVPAWNMSNKIQDELGATKSFTIGFSGGGSTNFLVALDYALAALLSDQEVNTVLLLGADVTIPGNRVLNPEFPLTVLGDGASAVVVGRKEERNRLLGTRLSTHGQYHDLCYIPGGGMTYPTRDDLYRLQVDMGKYAKVPKYEILTQDTGKLLSDCRAKLSDVKQMVIPNLSLEDQAAYANALGIEISSVQPTALEEFGHVQANDLAFNLIALLNEGKLREGDSFLICSHGMGFTSGAVFIQR